MKAADIPDQDFLAIVGRINRSEHRWAMASEVEAAFPAVPPKLLRAKASKLIRRGLMDGCACGCRGDYVVLTPEGEPLPEARP